LLQRSRRKPRQLQARQNRCQFTKFTYLKRFDETVTLDTPENLGALRTVIKQLEIRVYFGKK
jgi:hypothetical protein